MPIKLFPQLPEIEFPRHFVPMFQHIEEEGVIKLFDSANLDLLREFQELNDSYSQCFFLLGSQLFLEGNYLTITPIHENSINFFSGTARDHSQSLNTLGFPRHLIYNGHQSFQANRSQPDSTFRVKGRTVRDSNVVVEIAYSVGLRITHLKIQEYFSRCPDILAAIIVDIAYPWRQEGGVYDVNNGKLAFLYYERPFYDAPLFAISFGGTALTEEDVTRLEECTDLELANLRGHVEGLEGGLSCHQLGLPQFMVQIPGRVLFHNGNNQLVAGGGIDLPLDELPEIFTMNMDLFELQEFVLIGVEAMNAQ